MFNGDMTNDPWNSPCKTEELSGSACPENSPESTSREGPSWGVRCCGFSGSTTGLDEASPCDVESATIHRPGWSRRSQGFVAGEIGQFLGPWPWKNISSLCLDFLMCFSKKWDTTWRIYRGLVVFWEGGLQIAAYSYVQNIVLGPFRMFQGYIIITTNY